MVLVRKCDPEKKNFKKTKQRTIGVCVQRILGTVAHCTKIASPKSSKRLEEKSSAFDLMAELSLHCFKLIKCGKSQHSGERC